METENSSSKTNNKTAQSLNVLKIAAFCFAVVSFYATANGLKEYVFNNDGILPYLYSFAIQATLFVLSLFLFKFLEKVNGWHKKTAIVFLNVAFLFVSAFFSWVFICSEVYTTTKVPDAHIRLNTQYTVLQNELNEVIDNELKTIYDKIGDFYKIKEGGTDNFEESDLFIEGMPVNDYIRKDVDAFNPLGETVTNIQEQTKTNNKVIGSLNSIKSRIADIFERYDFSHLDNSGLNDLAVYVADIQVIIQRNYSDYDDAYSGETKKIRTYSQNKEWYKRIKDFYGEINSIIDSKLKKINDERSSRNLKTESQKQKLLAALLSPAEEEKKEKIETAYSELKIAILESDQGSVGEEEAKTFSELTALVEKYLSLSQCKEDLDAIEIAKENPAPIVITDEKDSDFQERVSLWQNEWKKDIEDALKIVYQLPAVSVELGGKTYNKEYFIREYYDLYRNEATKLNPLEATLNRLSGQHNALAWFSLVFAVFCDLSAACVGGLVYISEKK